MSDDDQADEDIDREITRARHERHVLGLTPWQVIGLHAALAKAHRYVLAQELTASDDRIQNYLEGQRKAFEIASSGLEQLAEENLCSDRPR